MPRSKRAIMLPCLLGVICLLGADAGALDPAGLARLEQHEQRRIELIDRLAPTVVLIYGEDPSEGGGSGVLIDPSGLALTNFHVVMGTGGGEGWAGLNDGKLRRWRLVGVDPGGDLALIQLLGDPTFPHAALGDSDDVALGQGVLAMGNPFALSDDYTPTVTLGVVSGTHRYQGGDGGSNLLVYGDCIQVDTSINPGNSGGPLFDLLGQLIGINGRASFSFVERGRVNVGLGYAISINQARRFLGELLATKVAQHATLDAVFNDRGDRVICTALDRELCPLVAHGFEVGDELLAFDGRAITSANQYLNRLTTVPAGWPVRVTWRDRSDGRTREAVVRLNTLEYDNLDPARMPRPPQPPPDDEDGQSPRRMRLRNAPFDPGTPGEIRNRTLNRELAELMLTRTGDPRFTADRLEGMKAIELQASDRIAGRPTVRIELVDGNDAARRVWVDVDGAAPLLEPSIVHELDARAMPMPAIAVGESDGTGDQNRRLLKEESLFTPAAIDAQRRTVKLIGAGIGREHGYATGVIVGPEGQVVTAEGVYLAASRLRAVMPDGSVHVATVERRDPNTHLALLDIGTATPHYYELADQPVARTGDWLLAVGNPFQVAAGAESLSVNLGIVSLRDRLDTRRRAQDFDVHGPIMLIDAITANPGSPGGALVTVDGRLAGMIGKVLESESTGTRLNYAVPNDVLADFIAGRPTVTDVAREAAGEPVNLGMSMFKMSGRDAPAYVDRVTRGSPAHRAGVRRDDLVLTINETWIRTVEDYEQAVGKLRAGPDIHLVVKRGDEVLAITIPTDGEAVE